LEAWNGYQDFDSDRIKRGNISIANTCVSIFGGLTPDKLTAYLEEISKALANDGMLQRFQLLVYPDPRPWEWRDLAPNTYARNTAFDVFETLGDFDPMAWGAAPADEVSKVPHFSFDAEAQGIFIEWSEQLHLARIASEEEALIAEHLSKYDKLFPV